jgi:hypothetical protein
MYYSREMLISNRAGEVSVVNQDITRVMTLLKVQAGQTQARLA